MAIHYRITALVLSLSALAWAQDPAPKPDAQPQTEPEKKQEPQPGQASPRIRLDYQTGKVTVGADLAEIDLPAGYRYLQQKQARMVVEKLWGNPPSPDTLGLVVPANSEIDADDGWAVIVSYEEEGHVKDDDAADIDYDELLQTMQSDTAKENEARRKRGYPEVAILGWAEPPHYDAASKKLYWAKSLRFGQEQDPTLNYNVRILGRRGVLVFNAVASTDQLPLVSKGCKELLSHTEFKTGQRYEEFNPGLDKVAAYGIGGLIAGKVLLKGGLLKLLFKPLLVVLAAVGAFFVKIFGRGKKKPESAPLTDAQPQ